MITEILDEVLSEREKTHGSFRRNSEISQGLKFIVDNGVEDCKAQLTPAQMEAIHMILHKISRIIAGNPNEIDHWRDIQGYARLAEVDTLKEGVNDD